MLGSPVCHGAEIPHGQRPWLGGWLKVLAILQSNTLIADFFVVIICSNVVTTLGGAFDHVALPNFGGTGGRVLEQDPFFVEHDEPNLSVTKDGQFHLTVGG